MKQNGREPLNHKFGWPVYGWRRWLDDGQTAGRQMEDWMAAAGAGKTSHVSNNAGEQNTEYGRGFRPRVCPSLSGKDRAKQKRGKWIHVCRRRERGRAHAPGHLTKGACSLSAPKTLAPSIIPTAYSANSHLNFGGGKCTNTACGQRANANAAIKGPFHVEGPSPLPIDLALPLSIPSHNDPTDLR